MPINEWWAADPAQKYWLEITDREDLGADLHAPKLDGSGRVNWTYELVRYVQPGDTVLHWHKYLIGRPALVGYSQAVGPLTEDTIIWQAHGTYGRARAEAMPSPSWRLPLRAYRELAAPVEQEALRAAEPRLRAVWNLLSDQYQGSLYFPFVFSDSRPIRTAQSYLTKFPSELLALLPGLEKVPIGVRRPPLTPGAGERPTEAGTTNPQRSARSAGYVADAVLRRAIEQHAVAVATANYQREGWTVTDVGTTRSYDLELTRGAETRHVEVKGSTQAAEEVELTIGEVSHSREPTPCDLFVVGGIEYRRNAADDYSTWGGRRRIWRDWAAEEQDLRATRFRYRLPGGADEI